MTGNPAESAIAKASRRLIPFLVLCYAVNFLDRVNVGFAALAMNEESSSRATSCSRFRATWRLPDLARASGSPAS